MNEINKYMTSAGNFNNYYLTLLGSHHDKKKKKSKYRGFDDLYSNHRAAYLEYELGRLL